MAILLSIDSNSLQRFNIEKNNFICRPYGILTLESLLENSENGSKCKETIESFYKKHPDLKYFTYGILKSQQMYHVEFRESRCLIYAQGQKTLSELLLEKGLAMNKSTFKDEEFRYSFEKAQASAKFLKLGMWNEPVEKECAKELTKE
ncbi:MAG: thermonuclease family protein [Campylobacterales bacterium]|nr:thermonuclease family protein [Campylobacterales bacterium]